MQVSVHLILVNFVQEIMASNRSQGGIQQLLAAEQEAQHIVNAARSGNFFLKLPYICLPIPCSFCTWKEVSIACVDG